MMRWWAWLAWNESIRPPLPRWRSCWRTVSNTGAWVGFWPCAWPPRPVSAGSPSWWRTYCRTTFPCCACCRTPGSRSPSHWSGASSVRHARYRSSRVRLPRAVRGFRHRRRRRSAVFRWAAAAHVRPAAHRGPRLRYAVVSRVCSTTGTHGSSRFSHRETCRRLVGGWSRPR